MKRIALFPGSFDPITKGHESIILRALPLFETIYVAIGNNTTKNSYFSIENRKEWLRIVFKDHPKVKIIDYEGLTVDLCRNLGANFILRGLRTSADFEFERSIGQMNKKMLPEVETIFMLTLPDHTPITSSVVREIYKNGGCINQFVPDKLAGLIK
jgi:pantetheine-phosphate adenylyltransferase